MVLLLVLFQMMTVVMVPLFRVVTVVILVLLFQVVTVVLVLLFQVVTAVILVPLFQVVTVVLLVLFQVVTAVILVPLFQVVTVVGGMSEQKQQRLLSRRPEVVVATPGRLWEFVEAADPFLSNLSHLKFLVVDETDRMLEKGHFQQLHLLLERVNADPERAARRQNFVFSATLTLDQQKARGRDFKQLKELTTEQKLKHITAMIGIRDKNKKVGTLYVFILS